MYEKLNKYHYFYKMVVSFESSYVFLNVNKSGEASSMIFPCNTQYYPIKTSPISKLLFLKMESTLHT